MIPVILLQVLFLIFMIDRTASALAHEKEYDRIHPLLGTKNYLFPSIAKILFRETVQQGITVLILMAEGIVLWRIRKTNYARMLALGYVLPLLFILVYLPVMGVLYKMIFHMLIPTATLYWIGLGVSHTFFAIMLWQARYRKTKFTQTDPANILDDYADKFN
jgi:hypothetical protein